LVKHIPGVFVWHPNLTAYAHVAEIMRVAFYTSVVGDEDRINAVKEEIASTIYVPRSHGLKVCPYVFKKPSKSQKSKNVDIAITIDALRHSYLNHIDDLYLFSGDGDYLPLIREVMRSGKRVFVGAFSSGLNPELKWSVDSFMDLDKEFFYAP
jgi:uncharacterized LabA/DUF88 family protein